MVNLWTNDLETVCLKNCTCAKDEDDELLLQLEAAKARIGGRDPVPSIPYRRLNRRYSKGRNKNDSRGFFADSGRNSTSYSGRVFQRPQKIDNRASRLGPGPNSRIV